MAENDVYVCKNVAACALGIAGEHGLFTGGATAEQITMLTGRPTEEVKASKEFGPGYCPNCGTKAEKTGEKHVSVKGNDPHQDLHDLVHARVEDEEDPISTETAQAELKSLVAQNTKGDEE